MLSRWLDPETLRAIGAYGYWLLLKKEGSAEVPEQRQREELVYFNSTHVLVASLKNGQTTTCVQLRGEK